MSDLKTAYLQWKHAPRTAPADNSLPGNISQDDPISSEPTADDQSEPPEAVDDAASPSPGPQQEVLQGWFEVTAIWTHGKLRLIDVVIR